MQERLILVTVQDVNIKCICPATNLLLKLASSASLLSKPLGPMDTLLVVAVVL